MILVVFLGAGSLLLVLPSVIERSDKLRRVARDSYSNNAAMMPARLMPAIAPFLGLASILMAAGLALPRPWSALVASAAIIAAGAVMLLSYRWPVRRLPRWLREAIERGEVQVAEPDRMDWLLFWLLATLLGGGLIGLLILRIVAVLR